MNGNYNHAEFEELCALANTGTLTSAERRKLDRHLAMCAECWEAYREYQLLATEAIPLLASTYAHPQEAEDWDERPVRKALFARIRSAEKAPLRELKVQAPPGTPSRLWAVAMSSPWLRAAAVVACIVASIGYGSYRLGSQRQPAVKY